MKITKISQQIKRPDRYSVYVDGKYEFSLHEQQLAELSLKSNQEVSDDQLSEYKNDSLFGKAYERTLKYVFMRPRSKKEILDYLARSYMYPKPKVYINKSGDRVVKKQVVDKLATQNIIDRVIERLESRGYVNDEVFAKAWFESRQFTKKPSRRKIQQELQQKGIDQEIIATLLQNYESTETDNLRYLIDKKRKISRYQDDAKLVPYLVRQGFSYSDIKRELSIDSLD
ncbi:RecX family transcriptional regulator [Candidatus Nomurabacteria bacterium]|nr:RecX family transcriptional regulator [Candidatus Nomurabacteria bacterium]